MKEETQPKTKMVTASVPCDFYNRIEDYQFSARVRTFPSAVRQLIQKGLEAEAEEKADA